jgi:hypothetical protein
MNIPFSIKTHRPGMEYSGVHFFILNKGLNSGKPLDEACPNCYVCECSNEEDKEALYWICFALWQSCQFQPYLIGSVIVYIRIKDFQNLVSDAFTKAQAKPELFEKALILLKTVNEKNHHFEDLAATLKKIKREVARDLVR